MNSNILYSDYCKIAEKVNKNFNIKSKERSWWHRNILGNIMKIFSNKYMMKYHTVIGSTLWMTENGYKEIENNNISVSILALLMHELQHFKQKKEEGEIIFLLKYLFPQSVPISVILLSLSIGIFVLLSNLFLGTTGVGTYLGITFSLCLITSLFGFLPGFANAVSRYHYEIEAYKISILSHVFFSDFQGSLYFINSVPEILTEKDYYYTMPAEFKARIRYELLQFREECLEKLENESKILGKEFDAAWENLKILKSKTA